MKEKKERGLLSLSSSSLLLFRLCSSNSPIDRYSKFSRLQVLTCSRSPDICRFIVLLMYRFIDGSSISSSHLLCRGGFLRFYRLLFLSIYRFIVLSIYWFINGSSISSLHLLCRGLLHQFLIKAGSELSNIFNFWLCLFSFDAFDTHVPMGLYILGVCAIDAIQFNSIQFNSI